MPVTKQRALTAARIKTLGPGTHTDGSGLALRVDAHGKRWVLRVTVDGQRRQFGLGGYPAVTLSKARAKAQTKLRAVRQGHEPTSSKPARPDLPTFQQVAEQAIDLRRPAWRNGRIAKQWDSSLRLYVYPTIGCTPIDKVTPLDVLAILNPIWHTKAETSTRVQQRMGVVFAFAVGMQWRIDNPVSAVASLLPKRQRTKRNHPALPHADVPAALREIRNSTALPRTKLALEFLILTAARSGEARGATWAEIDLKSATWTIPAHRMKMRRDHRVPLSDRAVVILSEARELSDGDGLVFSTTGKQITDMAFSMLLRRLQIEAVPHGFRSSFRTWAADNNVEWAAAETALAHRVGNSVEAIYIRTDLFDKRRGLMQQWADYLGRPAAGQGQSGRAMRP